MIGFAIVVAFALVAILAPVIAPFPRTFLAPDADRFQRNQYALALPANLTYQDPIMGPTTLLDDANGSMWNINYNASRGLIYMNLMLYQLSGNESPFLAANNVSRLIDVTQDFGVTPTPGLPVRAVYWIAPGRDSLINGTSGPYVYNGALAFFTGQDFVAGDPFNKTLFFNYHLDFTPKWEGQDPQAAGNLLLKAIQHVYTVGLGSTPMGPYQYFFASDGSHTVVLETTYVHAGYCPCFTPSGKVAYSLNASLSAPPFVYYNSLSTTLGSDHDYRSGPGQGLFFPLTNNTLQVVNVSGKLRGWVNLTLDGQPAVVAGNMSVSQTNFPLRMLLPLKSATETGLAYLDMTSLKVTDTYVIHSNAWVPIGTPSSRGVTGVNSTFASFYNPSNHTTFLVGLNDSAGPAGSGQFQVYMPGRLTSWFYAYEEQEVFVLGNDTKIYTLTTNPTTTAPVTPTLFRIFPPPGVRAISYAGAFGGTKYATLLSTQEMYGAWTDPTTGRTSVFQLKGTPRTPLAPGVYDSGLHYWWGTDFFGGDILTEWIYGTQVAFVVGLLAALFSVGIGTLVGVISGYYGKVVDTLLMRTTDVFLVLPFLPIVLVLISITAPSIWIIIMVIAILGWPGIARVIRAQVLSLKERPFVDAARVSGASDLRLVFLHIAPNVLPFSFLYMSLSVGGAIITEAALSFLGFGDPTVTSWGGMLSNLLTFSGGLYAYWWLLPPGLGITFLSLGFYLIGRGFDEIINPRLRRR